MILHINWCNFFYMKYLKKLLIHMGGRARIQKQIVLFIFDIIFLDLSLSLSYTLRFETIYYIYGNYLSITGRNKCLALYYTKLHIFPLF